MTTTPPVQLPTFHAPSGSDLDTWYEILLALTSAWPTYVPVLTASTTNPTYTATGAVLQLGKLIHFRANFVIITAGSGAYSISLPVATNEPTGMPVGEGSVALSNASGRLPRGAWQNTSTTVTMSDEATGARVTNTVPIAITAGSIVAVKGTYEAA